MVKERFDPIKMQQNVIKDIITHVFSRLFGKRINKLKLRNVPQHCNEIQPIGDKYL